MGALSGSISFVRFFVEGDVPPDFREAFLTQIKERVLRPLDPDEDEEEAIGWCPIAHPLRLELAYDDVFINNFVNLGLRVDRWVIPGPLLKARLAEAEEAALRDKDVLKLRRGEKDELRRLVVARLRRQLLPSMKVTDLSWDVDAKVVRFWSNSTRLHDRLEDLFAETFGLRLVLESPYTAARQLIVAERLPQLADVDPTLFHALPAPQRPLEHPPMDLVDLIAKTRFLGREFLVWLWFDSETFDGQFELPRLGAFRLWFESSITLEREHQGREQSRLIGAAPSTTSEAHEALRLGKLPTQARFRLEIEGRDYGAVLQGDTLALSTVSLPALLQKEDDERFHERMALLQELEQVRDALYGTFLELRLQASWSEVVLPAMRHWVADEPLSALPTYVDARDLAARRAAGLEPQSADPALLEAQPSSEASAALSEGPSSEL